MFKTQVQQQAAGQLFTVNGLFFTFTRSTHQEKIGSIRFLQLQRKLRANKAFISLLT